MYYVGLAQITLHVFFSKLVNTQAARGHHHQKAFAALLLAINEAGEVVDFLPTATQSIKSDAVQDMLHSIHAKCPAVELIIIGRFSVITLLPLLTNCIHTNIVAKK